MNSIIYDQENKFEESTVSKLPYQECVSCGDGTKLHQNLTATSQWINLVHKYHIHFFTGTLWVPTKNGVFWYDREKKDISYPYIIYDNGKLIRSYDIELNDEHRNSKSFDQETKVSWFLRLENCSARDSSYLPVKSITGISNCIEDSLRCQIFMRVQKELNIVDVYLFPFNYYIHLNRRYEFRAVVCKDDLKENTSKVTAICQYYRDESYTLEEINKLIPVGLKLINEFIEKYKVINEYVLDVFLMPEHETIIEVNSFGINGICGLPFFNWKDDYDQLYGKTNKLEVRFIEKKWKLYLYKIYKYGKKTYNGFRRI